MKIIRFVSCALLLFMQYGCLKDPDFSELSSNLVVVTNADSSSNFSQFESFYISDSIAIISSNSTDTILQNANTQILVDAIKRNMNDRGFQFVSKSQDPDLGINTVLVRNVEVGVITDGWWWGYDGYWDPWYWDWWYPYYYPWTITYVLKRGTIIIDIADLKNAPQNKSLRIIWNTVLGGAIGDDLDANVQRGVDAINQAFVQTPEFRTN